MASSYDCPRRKAILNKKEKLKEEAARKAIAKSERLSGLRNGVSYAAAMRTAHTTSRPPIGDVRPAGVASPARPGRSVAPTGGPAEYGNAIFEDCQAIFGRGFSEVLADVVKFGPQYRKLYSEGSRSSALVGLMLYIGTISETFSEIVHS